MFNNGFPKEWSTLRKLAWLYRTVINAVSAVLKTVTGNPIHILDALAKPAQALSVKLEPIQDLHGYDNPWPAGGGKNKFDLSAVYGFNANVSITKTADSFTVANANGYSVNAFCAQGGGDLTFNLPDGDYTISIGSATTIAIAVYASADGSSFSWIDNGIAIGNVQKKFTISGKNYIQFRASVPSNNTATISKFQLESGSAATAWTPYSNICPISGHTDADVTRTGKNLLPTPVAANAIKYNGGGLSVADVTNGVAVTGQANGSSHSVGFILLDADYFIGKTLTFSLAMVGSNSLPRAVVMYCDADCTNRSVVQVLNDTGSITFTVPSTAKGKKIGLGLFSTSGQDSLSAVSTYTNIQLELGSTASDYEEYRGTTYPIPLGTTVYGGTLDVKAGKMTVDRAITTALNSLSWEYRTGEYAYSYFASSLNDKKTGSINMLCSQYKTATGGRNTLTSDCMIAPYNISNSKGICIRDDAYSDATIFANSLAGVQLVYELATPITIQLTAQQVELLLGENNIWSDGEMTLTYLADGNASDVEALNILLGGRYVNNHGEDEPSDREALDILLGR